MLRLPVLRHARAAARWGSVLCSVSSTAINYALSECETARSRSVSLLAQAINMEELSCILSPMGIDSGSHSLKQCKQS